MKNKKIVKIIFLFLVLIFASGCLEKEKQMSTENISKTTEERTLTFVFKVGDTNTMLEKNVTLLAFDIEDSYAVLEIGDLRYDDVGLDIDVDIGDRIIKITDVDEENQTAEISMRYLPREGRVR